MRVFDLIVPLGVDCVAASQLKFRGLRVASFPFDWVTSELDEKRLMRPILSLENHFADWLKPENLDWERSVAMGQQGFHFPVYDKGTGCIFLHDFKSEKPDTEEIALVREKYARRIQRLYNMLERAKSVLFIFAGRDDEISGPELEKVRQRLLILFPGKDIMLYAVTCSAPQNTLEEDCSEDSHIFIQRCTVPREDYGVHVKEWSARWLDKVKLSGVIGLEKQDASSFHVPKGFIEKLHWKCYKHCRKFLIRHNCLGTTFD